MPQEGTTTLSDDHEASGGRSRLGTSGPPLWWAPAAAGVVLAIGILVGLRGFRPAVTKWGRPFWEVTYRDGFIRRGLLGSVFQALYGSHTFQQQSVLIMEFSLLVVVALLVGFAIWLAILVYEAPTRSHALRIVLLALPLIGSALFPTLIYDTGYVDGFILLIAFACTALLARQHLWSAVCIASLTPLIHEMFLFLWVPIAIFGYHAVQEGHPRQSRRVIIPALLLPFLSTALVVGLSSSAATKSEIDKYVVGTTTFKAELTVGQFGQSFSAALRTMEHLHAKYWWPHEVADIVYFCWPAILVVVLYMVWRWNVLDPWAKAALVVALLSPWATLLVAWDLSRLLLLANALVLMMVFALESLHIGEPLPPLGPVAIVILTGLAALAISFPFAYAWFDAAYYHNEGPLQFDLLPLLHWPMTHWMNFRSPAQPF
jgi:hypothetical protein